MESDNESSGGWIIINPDLESPISSNESSSSPTPVNPGSGLDFVCDDIDRNKPPVSDSQSHIVEYPAPPELERAYVQETEELGITLQTLLSNFLDLPDAGTPSEPPEAKLEFEFSRVAAHICRYNLFDESYPVTANHPSILNLPAGLDHPLVYQAIRKHMAARHTQRFVTLQALERVPNETGVDYLLAWICYELYAGGSGPNCPISLLSDLKSSFRSLNPEWRESMLWSLLKWLIGSQRITSCPIIISFYGSVGRYESALPFIHDLMKCISSTEALSRLLILPPAGESVVDNGFHIIDVDFTDPGFEAALMGDIDFWVETLFCSKPYLHIDIVRDEIQKQVERHYQDPILLISYLHDLGHRDRLTYTQLKEYDNLLITAENFTRYMLAAIHYSHRKAVEIVLSMIHQAMRPLTLAEVSTALVNRSTELWCSMT